MLRLTDLAKSFGARPILDDVSLAVTPGEKIALVGANGAGKTTLLKIVCGEDEPDSGRMSLSTGWTIGYLPQDAGVQDERTLWDEMLAAHADLHQLQHEASEIERSLGGDLADDELGRLIDRHADLLARFEARGGYRVEAEIHKVLAGLGFREADLHRRTDEFSGGWRTRIALAKLLVRSPDLLLLDEPTNHLDLDATEWLEAYLKASGASAIVVSHDRYFLDRMISRTVELEAGKLIEYAGNYSYYLGEKERRFAAAQTAYERQQRELKRQQGFIDRFRAKATKATQVKSREKMLAKIERIEAPRVETKTISLRFPPARPSHREVVALQNVVKRYGERTVFDGLALTLERGERLALVGPNGAGKSTLLRMLAEVEYPDRGTLLHGAGVSVGYYAQDQTEILNVNRTVLEEAWAAAPAGWGEEAVRTLLGRFVFRGDDVFKPTGVLSGGEKARLAIARLLLQPANLLLLDEPTNHLDLASREELERALRQFQGTVVLASHDRYFMDRVATKIGEVGGGQIRVYLGNYTSYRERRIGAGSAASPSAASGETSHSRTAAPAQGVGAKDGVGTGTTRKDAATSASLTGGTALAPSEARPDGRDRRRRRGPSSQERELAKIETELERVAGRRTEVEAMLADPTHYGEPGALEALAAEHAALVTATDDLEARWETLAEELSAASA
ncbi:MAG: ABC-F family ATP-binding cassette domain-containing protein [Chloroflexi bacterium]|nr:ABC-F family ATP-binding cassette domain-containing protein [Chloroflexota bacterium]